jgi:flagellar protein FlaH
VTTNPTRAFGGISTGVADMDRQMGGGVPWGCVTLIEGKHAAGKTVLCQHLAHSALQSGSSVAFYTSETGSPSLLTQMASLGLDVMDYFLLDRLRIYPLELTELYSEPDELLEVLLEHLVALPPEFQFMVVDSLTPFLPRCSKSTILNFLVECRQLCSQGKTIALTLDSRPTINTIATQLYPWCDVHLKLQMEAVTVERVVKALHVLKVTGPKRGEGTPKVHFDVQPGLGINIVRPKQSLS